MSYILYFFILIGFCVALIKIPFFKKSGLNAKWLIFLFLIRAIAGAFNCFLSYHFFIASDSLSFHNAALAENHWLRTYPYYFFKETFADYGKNFSGLLETSDSFWNNLKSNVIIKPLAILDIFTLRNFYINTLVFNIPVFTGSVALYSVLKKRWQINRTALAAGVFLFPTGLFFTSNIHREGLAWMALAFLILTAERLFTRGFKWKRVIIPLCCLVLIFLIRNYLSFALIPALIAWWLSEKNIRFTKTINALILLTAIIIFFNLKYLIPQADFPQYVVNRSAAFDEISVGSRTYLAMPSLTPDIRGFVTNLPVAAVHSFLLPSLWKIHNRLELPFILELMALEILFIIWIFKRKKDPQPISLFILFVCLSGILMIGYTVPNMGAIIRYRSIYLNLIFILLLSGVFTNCKRTY